MPNSKEQTRVDHAYQTAMEMIDNEWLSAGKTKEELKREKQLVELYDKLMASGLSPSEIHSDWADQTIEEILKRYKTAVG